MITLFALIYFLTVSTLFFINNLFLKNSKSTFLQNRIFLNSFCNRIFINSFCKVSIYKVRTKLRKACVCYFLSKFYFSPNDSPSKCFFISCKKLFSFSRYSNFFIFVFPLIFFPVTHCLGV